MVFFYLASGMPDEFQQKEELILRTWKYSVSYAEQTPETAPLPLDGPLEDALRLASEMGYDAIEYHTRENIALDLMKLRQIQSECGIRICSIVSGRLFTQGKCSLLDDAIYISERAMQGMQEYILLAETIGADLVIGWAKGVVPPSGNRIEYLHRLAGYLRFLGAFGQEHNVRIFLEVINRYETNIFNTAAETADFIRVHHLDNCYVHLDTFHMSIEEADPYEAIRYCGKDLGYIHVADNTRRYPGSGQLDFCRFLQTLEEIGYTGYVTVECFPYPNREDSARQALAHLHNCEQKNGLRQQEVYSQHTG